MSAPRTALLFLLAVSAGLFACGERGRRPMTPEGRKHVTFLTMQLRPTFDDYFLPLIEQYERENPDIDIDWIDYPWQNYETKLMTAFLARSAPDVINLPSVSLPTYIRSGTILPLDDIVDPEARASYVQSILTDSGVYDGQLWAVPWYAAPEVAFVNTSILKEAGLTIDDVPRDYADVPAFCETILEKTGKYGFYPVYVEGGKLRVFLWERGVSLVSEDGTRAAFNTPEGLAVFEFWVDLYRRELVPRDAVTATHRIPLDQYKTGNLAVLTTGPQLARQFQSDTPEIYEATEVLPLPRWKGHEEHLVSLFVFAVSARTHHPEESARFAEFLTNAPNQLEFAKRTVTLPSVTTALEDPFFTHPEDSLRGRMFAVAAQGTRKGQVFRPVRENAEVLEVLADATEAALLGNMTPKEALDDAEERVNEILGR